MTLVIRSGKYSKEQWQTHLCRCTTARGEMKNESCRTLLSTVLRVRYFYSFGVLHMYNMSYNEYFTLRVRKEISQRTRDHGEERQVRNTNNYWSRGGKASGGPDIKFQVTRCSEAKASGKETGDSSSNWASSCFHWVNMHFAVGSAYSVLLCVIYQRFDFSMCSIQCTLYFVQAFHLL